MGKTSLCFSNKHLVSVTKHTYYSFTHAKPTAYLEAGSPGHLLTVRTRLRLRRSK